MQYKEHLELNTHEYEIVSHAPIGCGAYGEIWEARRLTDETRVAIKTLRQKDDAENPYFRGLIKKARKDLEKEIQLLKTIPDAQKHFIMPLLDYGYIKDEPVMVLPLADKRKLSNIFHRIHNHKKIEYTLCELLNWVIQIAAALHKLHNHQDKNNQAYVHRDLKFSNILFLNNCAYLSDFGSTKQIQQTYTNSLAFTEYWAAPELIIPKKFIKNKPGKHEPEYEIKPSADIYSLGLMIYALITGEYLHCQRDLKNKIRSPEAPPVNSTKFFGTIGGLTDEEKRRYNEMFNALFQKTYSSELDNNETYKPFSTFALPNIELLTLKMNDLISQMLLPKQDERPDASTVTSFIKEIQNFLAPEIKSFKCKCPTKIFIDQSFEVNVTIDGCGLIKNELGQYNFPEESSWLCVKVGDHVADKIQYKGKQTWQAIFNGIDKSDFYTITAISHIYGKQIRRDLQSIKIFETPSRLWEKGNFVQALLSSENHKQRKKWLSGIQKESLKNDDHLIFWINILENIRDRNKSIADINELYLRLKNNKSKKKKKIPLGATIGVIGLFCLICFLMIPFVKQLYLKKTVLLQSKPAKQSISLKPVKFGPKSVNLLCNDANKAIKSFNCFDGSINESFIFEFDKNFKVNPNISIFDNNSGFIWQKSNYKIRIGYESVEKYLNYTNFYYWRIPTITELLSLMNRKKKYAIIDGNFFHFPLIFKDNKQLGLDIDNFLYYKSLNARLGLGIDDKLNFSLDCSYSISSFSNSDVKSLRYSDINLEYRYHFGHD